MGWRHTDRVQDAPVGFKGMNCFREREPAARTRIKVIVVDSVGQQDNVAESFDSGQVTRRSVKGIMHG